MRLTRLIAQVLKASFAVIGKTYLSGSDVKANFLQISHSRDTSLKSSSIIDHSSVLLETCTCWWLSYDQDLSGNS